MPMRVTYYIHQHINTISNNKAMDFSSAFQPIIAFVALLLLRALYKIAGHPKQSKKKTKFPFPEPSGALPFIGHLHLLGAKKPVARILGAMADKYGPIFSLRLGQQRTLIVSNWEMVKECFTTNDRIFATRPGIAVGKYIGYNSASFALSPYGQYWRDIRKMATLELFSAHRLEHLKRVRVLEVDSFIKELFPLCTTSTKSEAVVVPLSEMLEHLTFNLNLRLIVGKRFSQHMFEEKDSEVSRFKNAIKQALYLSGVFVWSDAIPWLEWLDIHGHVRSMKKTSKEIDAVLSKWLEEHKERKRACCGSIDVGVERDLMDVMLSTLSDEDLKSAGFSLDTVIKATSLEQRAQLSR
ncbi:hypothetical protein FEM48_Zijuj09G0081300 [Ziziphus jujuba var. spinosa]|uniref:Uncharacterized protein n=1 Tax=Ziziphus jujuba var. spinosa TaxID=714518 RepID=A0A978URU2_ZIZJJ|nr:hypothetical protein FEM48_Zijuj09G0081300 [Ziziphus jujuba var. spinosa]